MAEFYFQAPPAYEVEIMFSTYSFKFNSVQLETAFKPFTQIFFQRFTNLNEYPALAYIPFGSRYCAQIQVPNALYQTEYQKLFLNTLLQKDFERGGIVAETIDENAEFIYLIYEQNHNSNIFRYFEGCTLEIYQFTYAELTNVSQNAFNYLRNLQLSNAALEKQYIEMSIFYDFFKQHAASWQMQAANSDLALDKKIEEVQKKSVPKKPVCKEPVKVELPNVECLLCCNYPKNIVFLPCGHIVACKVCTTEQLDIVLGKIINQRRSPRICPICKQAIKEAREVFI